MKICLLYRHMHDLRPVTSEVGEKWTLGDAEGCGGCGLGDD